MALRLGTYNTQLFSEVQAKAAAGDLIGSAAALAEQVTAATHGLAGTLDPEQRARADRLASRVLDSPYDVVCFQEMWSEPAWWTLRDRLLAGGFIWTLGGRDVAHNLPEPAAPFQWFDDDLGIAIAADLQGRSAGNGLAVASRLPIVPFRMPEDGVTREFAFVRYGVAAASEGGARKGGGAFCVAVPGLGRIVIGFTHLQADYSTEFGKPYDDLRRIQLDDWAALLERVADVVDTEWIVACGDLNVRGEPIIDRGPLEPPRSAEYIDLFGWVPAGKAPIHRIGKLLRDAWSYSSPEEAAITNQERQRLDYVLTSTSTNLPTVLADHVMLALNLFVPDGATPLAETPFAHGAMRAEGGVVRESDHTGVNAVLARAHPAGTPEQAALLSVAAGDTKSVSVATDHGSCAWVVLRDPGTYSVAVVENPPGIGGSILAFEPHDLSAPVVWADPAGTPPPPPPGIGEIHGRVSEVHRSGGPATRLYVRATTETDAAGTLTVVAYRYSGTTPTEAILVDPNVEHALNLAPGHHDLWIELQLDGPPTDPTRAQTVQLDVRGNSVKVGVFDAAVTPAPAVVSTPAPNHARVVLERRGPERVLVRCNFLVAGPHQVIIKWTTNLMAIHGPTLDASPITGAGPLYVHVDDETGLDWPGADEVTIVAAADLTGAGNVDHNDADTGEYLTVGFGAPDPARFVDKFEIHITEHDPDGDSTGGLLFPDDLPVGVGIPALNRRRPIRVGSGTYALFYNVSGWLRRKNL